MTESEDYIYIYIYIRNIFWLFYKRLKTLTSLKNSYAIQYNIFMLSTAIIRLYFFFILLNNVFQLYNNLFFNNL